MMTGDLNGKGDEGSDPESGVEAFGLKIKTKEEICWQLSVK